MAAINRRVGQGGAVSFGSTSLTSRTSWKWDPKANTEDFVTQDSAQKQRISVDGAWEASVEMEYRNVASELGATLSIGSIVGAITQSYEVDVTVDMTESPAQEDDWRVQIPQSIDVELSTDSWVPSTSWGPFVTALIAQVATPADLAVVTAFGNWTALIESVGLDASDLVKETTKLPLAAGDYNFTPSLGETDLSGITGLFTDVNAYVTSLLIGDTPAPSTLNLPCGSGDAFVSKMNFKVPEGHITGSVTFTGVGAFTLSGGA